MWKKVLPNKCIPNRASSLDLTANGGDATERREVGKARSGRPKPLFLVVVAISLRSVSGLSDDHPGSKDAVIADANPSNSSSNTRHEVLFICLGVVGIAPLFVFLLKLWEKKKREGQHARLLRLFEEDDELELELGLRD